MIVINWIVTHVINTSILNLSFFFAKKSPKMDSKCCVIIFKILSYDNEIEIISNFIQKKKTLDKITEQKSIFTKNKFNFNYFLMLILVSSTNIAGTSHCKLSNVRNCYFFRFLYLLIDIIVTSHAKYKICLQFISKSLGY